VRFDNIVGSAADRFPSGATIASAKLILFSDSAPARAVNDIEIHRMLTSWSESPRGTAWAADRCQRNRGRRQLPILPTLPRRSPITWFSDVTDTVQAWANGAAISAGP